MTSTTKGFAELLQSAVNEPGIVSAAYSQFHQYSIGNQVLAWVQCLERGIQPGPMATYPRWKELGRYVRKGEKAIVLCMPVTMKRKATADTRETSETTEPTEAADDVVITRFIYRPNWFVFAQTDGKPLPEPEIPTWDKDQALQTLGIPEVPFDETDGNILGFARERSIAINP